MIISSSKNHGTGNVLMILDGETLVNDIKEHLARHYGVEDINTGCFIYTAECFGNQVAVTYIHKDSTEQTEGV